VAELEAEKQAAVDYHATSAHRIARARAELEKTLVNHSGAPEDDAAICRALAILKGEPMNKRVYGHPADAMGSKSDSKPPAAPEMPERVDGWWWDGIQYRRVDPHDDTMSLDTLRCLLKLADLSICTEAERKVLEACERAPEDWLSWWRKTGGGAGPGSWMQSVGEAELARRGQP
jgi:hypothetical protein